MTNNLFLNPWRIIIQLIIVLENMMSLFPVFSFFKETRNNEYPITLIIWLKQKVFGVNKLAYWPMHPSSQVTFSQRILIGKNVFPGYQFGCFLHGQNGIIIDDYTFIAPNVGIMSGNHDVRDLRVQIKNRPVKIGKYCWLGMNSVILPEVELGDFTIVGAGSIVTKSFYEGYCVVAGNPAKIIKRLDPKECVAYEEDVTHIGYISIKDFEQYAIQIRKNICVE